MAQRLARRAEDREVPGSSPAQDQLFNHVRVTSKINWEVEPHQNRPSKSRILAGYQIINFTYFYFTFKYVIWLNFASFESFQNNQLVAFLFILNLHKPEPGPKSRVFDWLRHSEVKVFVSLCSYSTCRCVRGSEQIGIETVGKNNGERMIQWLRYRGGVSNVWR